jgi:CRP-like cAMP-binding protein
MALAAAAFELSGDAYHLDKRWRPAKPGLHGHFEMLREHAMRLRFSRNDAIFRENEAAAHVYILASGCVRVCRHVQAERRHISDFLFADEIFGLGDFDKFPHTSEAVSPVTLLAYPRTAFERLGEDNPAFQNCMMSHFRTLLDRAQRRLFVTTCLNARERVASFVLQMHGTHQIVLGDLVDLPMARQEIADYLGLTAETICRALASLKSAGLIAVPNAHQITVTDPCGLRALTDGIPVS